jgi:hypothetical protein
VFIQPLYCGVLLTESLMLNRRRDDSEEMDSDALQVDPHLCLYHYIKQLLFGVW